MAALGRYLAILLRLFLAGASADFIVTHSPKHVQFLDTSSSLKLSEVQDVISSAFGLQVQQDMSWDGLGAGNIFRRPKANVLFTVETMQRAELQVPNVAKYGTEQDLPMLETGDVSSNLLSVTDNKPLVVDFSVEDTVLDVRSREPDLFQDVPATYNQLREAVLEGDPNISPAEMGSLNTSKTPDLNFVGELHIVKQLLAALKMRPELTSRRSPDFLHFRIQGLRRLSTEYGAGSTQLRDATELLQGLIAQWTKDLRELYNDNVVVEVATVAMGTDEPSFKARRLLQQTTAAPSPSENYNLAEPVDPMYPIIFNIVLWTMVTLAIAIIWISCGIWNMDPGRDSIIYRMTSQRIKKE